MCIKINNKNIYCIYVLDCSSMFFFVKIYVLNKLAIVQFVLLWL